MKENMQELKLEDENEGLVVAKEAEKKFNKKKARKKIKISPFFFISIIATISVFLLFNLVLMPLVARHYSNSTVNNMEIPRAGGVERHFNKGEMQTQFTARNINIVLPGVVNNGGTSTPPVITPGKPTGNIGPGPVVTPVQEVVRPNPFN